ncbi:kinetochore-associated protein DSN1 homolog [Brachyhypopomus gauderio]|uniref:kinetochore-associated protein DSN1 homolog n=1 Tax=Brachyhypopomus gauderio TaxID=698409 RepID=UPI004040F525
MADRPNEKFVGPGDISHMVTSEKVSQGIKRPSSGRTPSPEPPPKIPCNLSPPTIRPTSGGEKQPDEARSHHPQDVTGERAMDDVAPDFNLCSRRKSWRRSTRGRRSLPALPSTSQSLCKYISQDLRDEERLERLMEAAMQHTVKRLQDSLSTMPGADLESLQTQVDSLQREWNSVAKNIREEHVLSFSSTNSDPAIQKALEHTKETISRLQAESSSWESLLNKHRSKAEELARRVEQGQKRAVTPDASSLAQSSQSKLLLNKPDYHAVLRRQQRALSTMQLVMDSQCMMVKEILSFQEQSQLLMKETSARLACSAGLQDLPSSPARELLNGTRPATSS